MNDTPDPAARLAAEVAVLREALFALTTAYHSPLWVRRRAWAGIQDADRARGGAVVVDATEEGT